MVHKRCFVSKCFTSFDKENGDCLFVVPRGQLVEWQEKIPHKPGLTARSVFCQRHFREEDIIKGRLIGDNFFENKMWRLRKGAYPSLLLGNEDISLSLRDKNIKSRFKKEAIKTTTVRAAVKEIQAKEVKKVIIQSLDHQKECTTYSSEEQETVVRLPILSTSDETEIAVEPVPLESESSQPRTDCVDAVMTLNEDHLQSYECANDSHISLDTNEEMETSERSYVSVNSTVVLTNASLSFVESTIEIEDGDFSFQKSVTEENVLESDVITTPIDDFPPLKIPLTESLLSRLKEECKLPPGWVWIIGNEKATALCSLITTLEEGLSIKTVKIDGEQRISLFLNGDALHSTDIPTEITNLKMLQAAIHEFDGRKVCVGIVGNDSLYTIAKACKAANLKNITIKSKICKGVATKGDVCRNCARLHSYLKTNVARKKSEKKLSGVKLQSSKRSNRLLKMQSKNAVNLCRQLQRKNEELALKAKRDSFDTSPTLQL